MHNLRIIYRFQYPLGRNMVHAAHLHPQRDTVAKWALGTRDETRMIQTMSRDYSKPQKPFPSSRPLTHPKPHF